MKRFGICLGLGSILLVASCSDTGMPVRPVQSGKSENADPDGAGDSDEKPKKNAPKTDEKDEVDKEKEKEKDKEAEEKPEDKPMDKPKDKPEEKPMEMKPEEPKCSTSPGKAIKFAERVKDMVAGDLGADGTMGDKPRTIELWAKFSSANSWTAEQSILELGKPSQPDNGNNVFGIDMSGRNGDSGVFGPYTHGVSDNNGGNAPPKYMAAPNIGWLHLSWSYDPSKSPANKRFEFTVNGNVLPTDFNQGAYSATGNKLVGNTGFLLLGASQNFGNEGWEGVMDEVRIWSVARTAQQVKDSMNVILKPTTPGLIAYYQFNEADAGNIKDSTGNAAHKLAACSSSGSACPSKNDAAPKFVDSDVPGTFTCGQ